MLACTAVNCFSLFPSLFLCYTNIHIIPKVVENITKSLSDIQRMFQLVAMGKRTLKPLVELIPPYT